MARPRSSIAGVTALPVDDVAAGLSPADSTSADEHALASPSPVSATANNSPLLNIKT
jgi:hypothetical protein